MDALIFAPNLDPFALVSSRIIALSASHFGSQLWNAIIRLRSICPLWAWALHFSDLFQSHTLGYPR